MLNTKSCLVLATEDGMISSSHVWGMRVPCARLHGSCLHSESFLGLCVAAASLWCHEGAPFPPHTKASCATPSCTEGTSGLLRH